MVNKYKKISVVVPIYNEEAGIYDFLQSKLIPTLKDLKMNYEVVLVDDGSTDKTAMILQKVLDRQVKLISFSRNFGKEAAISAGLKYSVGDAVLIIDADGQHPVKLIREFVNKWQEGAEVVVGVRKNYGKHSWYKRWGSRIYYKLLKMMGDSSIMANATDYRLLDREVVDEYNRLVEHNRIARGLIDWLGFKREFIKYTPEARAAGKPSYNRKKLVHLALDSFVSMSVRPLMMFGYLGGLITILGFGLGLFCLIQQHILGDPLGLKWDGALEMGILIAFLIGLLMVSQSVTALYISQIHTEAKNRPLYVINKKQSKLD